MNWVISNELGNELGNTRKMTAVDMVILSRMAVTSRGFWGVQAEKILKLQEGRPNLVDAIKNGEIQLVVNTPIGKLSAIDDSYIRKAAIKFSVPYILRAVSKVKG